jgi:hypothetical protein
MSGVTASSTFTVVLTPYTTAEPAASAMAKTVQPDRHGANTKVVNKTKDFMAWVPDSEIEFESINILQTIKKPRNGEPLRGF